MDRLELLAKITNDEISRQIHAIGKAFQELDRARSTRTAMRFERLVNRMMALYTQRDGYRTHSETWRARPGTGIDGSRTTADVLDFDE